MADHTAATSGRPLSAATTSQRTFSPGPPGVDQPSRLQCLRSLRVESSHDAEKPTLVQRIARGWSPALLAEQPLLQQVVYCRR